MTKTTEAGLCELPRAVILTQVRSASRQTRSVLRALAGAWRPRGGFLFWGVIMIRGNTGERYQEIAIAAEQLAGPVFMNQTGTLVERLTATIEICREASWMAQGAVDQLERLLNSAKVEELLKCKPR